MDEQLLLDELASVKQQLAKAQAQVAELESSRFAFERLTMLEQGVAERTAELNHAKIGTVLDITERKEAEMALRQALERELELGELKSRFVSMASHELRTPLATILASAETLLAYRARMDPTQIERKLNRIVEQVEHLRAIIDDVLQFSRIESGRVQFDPREHDLDALCQEIVAEFQDNASTNHMLQYTCAQPGLTLLVDRDLMRQAIANLISNAIKYSASNTSVYVHLERAGDEAVLCVRDDGIGMSEADQKRLFEPFFRAANAKGVSGTGLGLAIAKEAVERHGGRVTVQSRLGSGSTICVSVPCRTKHEADDDQDSRD